MEDVEFLCELKYLITLSWVSFIVGSVKNLNSGNSIAKSVERIYTILKEEKVGMVADLTDKAVYDMNIAPDSSYGENRYADRNG